jgi:hypothetical protein
MDGLIFRLAIRGIAGIAGFLAVAAAALHRKSSSIEARARKRLAARNGYGIGALEHDCWDRDGRSGFGGNEEPGPTSGKPA